MSKNTMSSTENKNELGLRRISHNPLQNSDTLRPKFTPPSQYPLGLQPLQQASRVAVALIADDDQSDEGRQEDGGQHADGHDHHRLHADTPPFIRNAGARLVTGFAC